MFNRREFIKTTSLTATMAAAGQLPLWSAQDEICYAEEGFSKFLKSYKPPKTSTNLKQFDYTLVNMGKQYGQLKTTVHGSKSYSCIYSVKPCSACEAEFVVDDDLLSGLRSWSLTSMTDPVSRKMSNLGSYMETGKVRNGKAIVREGHRITSEFRIDYPLLPDWLLPLAVPMIPAKQGAFSFSLLREGTYFLGNQQLVYDGTAQVELKGGKTMELSNYLHFGEGTLPTNYLVDHNRVTIIVTHGLTAEVLS